MADARYIIDIILNARDNTSEAMGKLMGNQRELMRLQQEAERQNTQTAQSFESMTQKINVSQAELLRQTKALNLENQAQAKLAGDLERASAAHARNMRDESQGAAALATSLEKVRTAENALVDSYEEGDKAAQRRNARRIAENAAELERLRQVRTEADKNAKAEAQADKEREQAHAARMKEFTDQARARQRFRAEERQAMAQEEAERRREHQKTLDIINKSEQEAQRRREQDLKDIMRLEDERRRKEADAARERRRDLDIINRSEREAQQRREQDLRNVLRLEGERKRAFDERMRKEEQELQLGRRYLEQIQQIQRVEEQRKKAAAEGDFVTKQRLEFDSTAARREAEATAAELKALFSNIEANIDLDTGGMTAHAAEVLAMKELLGKDVKIDVDFDVDLADIAKVNAMSAAIKAVGRDTEQVNQRLGLLRGTLRAASEGFHGSSQTISSFDNFLRGLMSLGIATFFNQLFLLASAGAGALFSLASSAAFAGAAVGGSLVAGIAQALGPLGLLAAAAGRVAAVMDVVQQANLLQQQQSYQGAQAARQQATATDQVRGAQERLADAGRRIGEAQKNVNDARQEGIDKLNELILAERGLSLTVEESETAIRRAAARGDTAALPRAFLRREEAQQELGATRAEIGERRAAGPEASPEIVAAKEQLRDAQRAAREAERSLAGAKRSADQAAEGVTAAAGKLNYLLGQLSGAERRLYEAVLRLQTVWRDFAQFATEPIINAFTRTINRIITLLQDPRIRNAARSLAQGLATQIGRILDAFTSDEAIGQFLRIVDQAKDNLKPLTDIAIDIGKAFLDIAEAAGPALGEIIEWVRDIADDVAKFFEAGRKSGDLQDFFKEGVVHLKAWGDLLWAVIELFAALAGPGGGASNGLQLVRDIADAIRGWADAIDTPGTKLNTFFNNFFELSRQMIEAMAPVLEAIAEEFDKTFTKDGLSAVEGFATFLAEILIPAIGDFARGLGRVTAALGDFIEEHPQIAKIASAILATAFAFSVLGRAFAIFGTITRPIAFLISRLFEVEKVTVRLGGIFGRMGGIFLRLRPFLLGPWGALIAIIIILLQRAGKLDDIWRQIISTAKDIIRIAKPAFDDLKDSVQELIDRVSKGGGLFGVLLDVLTAIASVVGDVLIQAIRIFGLVVGRIVRGVLRVFGGVIDIITAIIALFQGDFGEAARLALRGLRRIFSGIFDVITSIFVGIGDLFIKIGGKILSGLKEGIKGLPDLLSDAFDLALDGLSQLDDLFLEVGKTIINAVVDGIKSSPDILADALGWIIDQVPAPGFIKGKIKDALGLQEGGPVPGSGSGDTVPALLEPGEHVWTKREVEAAGGHDIIFALRRMLGGGGQGGTRRYQSGGAVLDPRTGLYHGAAQQQPFRLTSPPPDAGGDSPEEVEKKRKEYKKSGDERAKDWRLMWSDMLTTVRRAANDIEEQIRDLKDNSRITMRRMRIETSGILDDIVKNFKTYGGRIEATWIETTNSLKKTIYEGLTYIGHETNKALDALGADIIHFGLQSPSQSRSTRSQGAEGSPHAAGGMVGMSGERGEDRVRTVLGRGEAVLNWAHQKVVNSALWNQYGTTLDGLFKSTNALHAGLASPGYARGGFTGPGHSGEGFNPVWNMAQKKFGMTYFTGYDGHNKLTSSGNVSDHWYHRALDMGNGVLTAGEDALNAFVKTKIPQVVKQLIWRDKDQYTGYPIGGHLNHIHLAMKDAFAFDGPLMAKLLSRSLRGLSIAKLLQGVTDSDQFDVDHVDRVGVKGVGPLRELLSKMLNKTRKAANRFIDNVAIQFGGGTDALGLHGVAELSNGPAAKQVFDFFRAAGFTEAQAAAWVGNLQQESGLSTTAYNSSSGATGLAQWLGGRLTGLRSFAAERGQNVNSLKTQLDYILWELQGPESAAASAIRGADTLHEAVNAIAFRYERMGANEVGDRFSPAQTAYERFGKGHAAGGFVGGEAGYARGGELPGVRQGEPMSIVAHAGEWILNRSQQAKLANVMGTTTSALKRLLGFAGTAKASFADGGEVLHIGDSLGVGIQRALRRMVDGLVTDAREGRNSDQAVAVLKEKLKKAYREVIFDVGTNDAHASVLQKNLKRAYRLLRDDQELILSTVRGPGAADKNRILRQFAGSHENVTLVNTRGVPVGPDGIHMDAAGYRERARLLARATRESRAKPYEAPLIDPLSVSGLEREMDEVFKAINQIGKKGKLGERIDKFVKNIRNLTDEGGFLDQMGEAIERIGTRMETSLALAQQGFRRVGSRFGRLTRRSGGPLADAVQIANRTVDMYEAIGDALRTARAEARQGLTATQRQINRIKRGGISKDEENRFRTLLAARTRFQTELSDLDSKYAENRENLYQALQDRFTATTERALRASTQRAGVLNLLGRVTAALGNDAGARQVGEAQLANLRAQQAVLQRRFYQAASRAARDPRWQAMADDLAEQLRDVTASIYEQQAENLKAVFEAVQQRYANATRRLDIRDRIAAVAGAAGNRLGAIVQQRGVGLERVGLARGEVTELTRLLATARAQGNVGVVQELTERIDELNTSIVELNQANQDLIFTYRQTATEIITGRAERATGIFGSARSIIEALGKITGTTQFGQIAQFLQQAANQLKIAAQEIADNVTAGAGEFGGGGTSILQQLAAAFRQGPQSFATKLAELGPAIAALESTMGDTQRSAFQALIQSMLDNTLAVLDNTDQLNQINNPTTQSFSSSLWQNLRMALFSGNAQPLYQYLPHFQAGGVMPYTGAAYLHAGEIITNPRRGQIAPGSEEHTHVHLHNVEKDVDIGHAFEVVEFKRSQRRAT